MGVFDRVAGEDYEQVVFNHDRSSGLRAIIAIHSTALGPALGGTRYWHFDSEEAALTDALRLAKAMTYKNAAAGLDLGGGKAVILAEGSAPKSEELLRAYGRFIDTLGGRYITAEDVGTTGDDMDMIHRETRWVTGISPAYGITAGGVINVADELNGYDERRERLRIESIFRNVAKVLETARKEGVTPSVAANRVAEARIRAVGRIRQIRGPQSATF